ncbi:MAG: CDP-glucose 4,6-dehydratase, partial [Elusimicrobia bacterium]|nr:CDP-glucose 4,6-dehydratase [Elusimicrobiota bacterium]
MEGLEVTDAFGGAFRGRRVLVTGHTGFKGSWLSLWLAELGAEVSGYALAPDESQALFGRLGLERRTDSRLGDVRDAALLEKTLRETRPEIVFHLAAQPLVRASYAAPAETFAVNVQGTANVLDSVRRTETARAVVVVTTDKVYENREDGRAYREDDRLGGRDPYSASKAAAEIVAASYRASFFSAPGAASIATARAGNVIGGGDDAADRLLPDCVRALTAGRDVVVRNPASVRPWQHVLEPLSGYLRLAERQLAEPARFASAWNFGPSLDGAGLPVLEVARL